VDPLPAISCAKVRVAPASEADAPALQACMDAARDYFVLTEGAPADAGAARDLLADAAADEERRVFLLRPRDDGPAIGFLDLHLHQPEPGVAHVGVLALVPAARGRGLGREVVEGLARSLVAAGFTALRCSVGDENPEALAFWERLGFEPVGRIERRVTVCERALG
jgi:ribosomal protein S18 acetylase RimI-like enzyme